MGGRYETISNRKKKRIIKEYGSLEKYHAHNSEEFKKDLLTILELDKLCYETVFRAPSLKE